MEEDNSDFLFNSTNLLTFSYTEMLVNMLLAILLGFVITGVYRHTHKGLSYSQSFSLTILFVTFIVAVVMMVIGSSLARAFALVGALSIIRFRTVVKDTKDTAFVFAALAVGMAAGTSNYFLAAAATFGLSILAVATHHFNYAALYKSEFVLRFMVERNIGEDRYIKTINQYARVAQLLHLEPVAEGELVKMTYDIHLKEDVDPAELTAAIDKLEEVTEVVLIAAKSDIDY